MAGQLSDRQPEAEANDTAARLPCPRVKGRQMPKFPPPPAKMAEDIEDHMRTMLHAECHVTVEQNSGPHGPYTWQLYVAAAQNPAQFTGLQQFVMAYCKAAEDADQ